MAHAPEPLHAVDATDTCLPILGEVEDWEHVARARRTLRFGEPHHSSQGAITVTGSPTVLHGKFAYGLYSKDLEGEVVRTFVRTGECEWMEAERSITNSDGRSTISLPSLVAGVYDYRIVVAGDHSWARGVIAVLDADTEIVVFDIDGTLTTSDGEVFDELFYQDVPDIFPYAAAVAQYYAAADVQPIYITGRAYHLQGRTVEWLDLMRLPTGPLHTTDSVAQALPGGAVEDYKLAFLEHLSGLGLRIVAAYGNASSDVCAYARAGVPPEHTYIVGRHAGNACPGYGPTQALEGYNQRLLELRNSRASELNEPAHDTQQ